MLWSAVASAARHRFWSSQSQDPQKRCRAALATALQNARFEIDLPIMAWSHFGKLRFHRRHGRAMRLNFRKEACSHIRVFRSDIEGLTGIGLQIKEQRRFVRVRLRLAVTVLREKVELPAVLARGEEARSAIIEHRSARTRRAAQQSFGEVLAIDDSVGR